MTNSKLRAILYVTAAAAVLSGCGADDVASPGEGNVIVITPPAPPPPPAPAPTPAPTPTPTPTPTTPTGPAAECPTGTTSLGPVGPNDEARACQIPNSITGTYNIRNLDGVVYAFSGRVEVGTDVGGDGNAAGGKAATLNIEAGTTLYATSPTSFIIVNRGSTINAAGEADKPIIFTSQPNIEGQSSADDSDRNQWGGILLLGRAPIDNCNAAGVAGGSANCQALAEGAGTADFYGGNVATDNSGIFRYVQIRYTGRAASPNNELQGLTLAGVGSNTTIEYVQSHNSGDDGIEIFGGTVNNRYLLLTGADDDSFDLDVGYVGSSQFIIAVQQSGFGDTLLENDDDDASKGSYDAVPRTNSKLANFTFVQRTPAEAMHIRGGGDAILLNGIVTGQGSCLDVDQAETVQAADPAKDEKGPPVFQSVVFDCEDGPFISDSDGYEAQVFTATADNHNLTDYTNSLQSVFINGNAENAVTAVANVTAYSAFFQQVNYIGAVRDANDTWYRSWSCNAGYVDFGSPMTCVNSPLTER